MENLKKLTIDKSNWTPAKFGDVVFEPKESVKNVVSAGIEHVVGLEHIDPESVHLRRSAGIEESTTFTKKFSIGDVLFGRRRAYLKKAAQATFEGICSGDITVMRAKENLLPELLPFVVQNDKFFDYAIKHSAGGLSPRVKFKDLANYEFLLPPKDQQAQLAKLLWSMDKVIESELEVLEKLVATYISKIEKDLLNKKYEKTFLNSLGIVVRGVGYKPKDLLDKYNNNTCIILRSNNISDAKINYYDIKILSKDKVKDIQYLIDNDFAICMSNGSKELVGKSARFWHKEKNVSIGSFCAAFRANSKISAELLEHIFASDSYRQGIKRILSGSAINNLKPSDIESLYFRVITNKTELRNILNELRYIIDNRHFIETKINSSKSLQKSLINEVF